MPRPAWFTVRPRALLFTTLLIAAVLLVVVLLPQVVSREARMQVLRNHVGEVSRLVASQVDGDLHRRLIERDEDAPALRAQLLEPLLRLHAAWPEAIYVYTMGVRDGMVFFVADTAQDEAFAKQRQLRASRYGEPFQLREEYASNWLDELAAGRTYVNEGFQHDDYGYFLSGHAPVHDGEGRIAGFAGVDFDLDYYRAEEQRFRQIEVASIVATLLLSLVLGFIYARYRYGKQLELQHHYEISMQDALTGLPNRRGAMAAIDAVWRETDHAPHAALLVDIDNFKSINDGGGHATGDDVIRALADHLRASLRPGDVAARLGGDEFLIFARDCDLPAAERIAACLLDAVRGDVQSPVQFGVSVGISVTTSAEGGFDRLYRQADSALYSAKNEGRDRYAVYMPV